MLFSNGTLTKKARKKTAAQYKSKTDTSNLCRAERLVRHDFPTWRERYNNAVMQAWQLAGEDAWIDIKGTPSQHQLER